MLNFPWRLANSSTADAARRARANDHRDMSLLLRRAKRWRAGGGDQWLCGFYARGPVKKSIYLLVSRQPAASASSTEQNQRVPLLIFILIWAYHRLFLVW